MEQHTYTISLTDPNIASAHLTDDHAAVLIMCSYLIRPISYEQASLAMSALKLLDALGSLSAYHGALITTLRLGSTPSFDDVSRMVAEYQGVPEGPGRAQDVVHKAVASGADPRSTYNLVETIIFPVKLDTANRISPHVTTFVAGPEGPFTRHELASVLILSEFLVRRAENNNDITTKSIMTVLNFICLDQARSPTNWNIYRSSLVLTMNLAFPDNDSVRVLRDKMLGRLKFTASFLQDAKSIACDFLRRALPQNDPSAKLLIDKIIEIGVSTPHCNRLL